MRRSLQGWLLFAGVCIAPGTQVPGALAQANPTGPGGAPAMMVNRQQVTAPNFRGMTLQEAQAANVMVSATGTGAAEGAKRQIFSALNATGPEDGVVETQTPAAGTKVFPGRQTASLSLRTVQVTVPVLRGLSLAEARTRLAQSSLVLGGVSGAEKSETPLSIATQMPLAGASVAANSAVDVVLETPVVGGSGATGIQDAGKVQPVLVTVPSVLKLRAETAAANLEAAGLGRAIVLGPADGVVVFQTPAAGALMATGGRVRLTMGTQVRERLVPEQTDWTTWGWWVAGGVVLLGSVLAIVYGVRRPGPLPPQPRRRRSSKSAPAGPATMVVKANAASAKVTVTDEPAVQWSVRLQDQPAAGVTTVQGGIESERKGKR